jgi:hypothetical protein
VFLLVTRRHRQRVYMRVGVASRTPPITAEKILAEPKKKRGEWLEDTQIRLHSCIPSEKLSSSLRPW